MNLADYFANQTGIGVLATCDPGHKVDVAIYAKPHFIDENTVAFVMKQRRSHQNLRANLQAAYMFVEDGHTDKGLRMYLTMIRQETNRSLVAALRKKQPSIYPEEDDSDKFLVFFRIDQVRPLVGDDAAEL